MTNNLINTILATCLLFSSLNLAAEQISNTNEKAQIQFLAGEACLQKPNIACAMTALAKIPSNSPYAKLLNGEIAYTNQSLDQALQLLLPLQAEASFTAVAKTSLHQYLANAFIQLQDNEQALLHLLQVDSTLLTTLPSDQKNAIKSNQAKIWGLLSKLEQSELIAMRGNNTDSDFQGWVDLALAAKNQDLNNSLKNWQMSYQDHPATAFSENLLLENAPKNSAQQMKLSSTDRIIVSYAPNTDEGNAKANAFKAGLEAALLNHGLMNTVQMLASVDNEADSILQKPLSTNPYAIILNTNQAPLATEQTAPTEAARHQLNHQPLVLSLTLAEEAKRIVKFASKNTISHVAILVTDDTTSTEMFKQFDTAWQEEFNVDQMHSSFNIIKLPQAIPASDPSLLDIQTQINAKAHDMVLLAMSASDARTIKPYLDVGTPTLAFSNLHERAIDPELNAVRFVEIPFLLPSNTQFSAHQNASNLLESNELLRWYALGVDALSILVASQLHTQDEILLNGLTGKIRFKNNIITHEPSIARFTYQGVTQE